MVLFYLYVKLAIAYAYTVGRNIKISGVSDNGYAEQFSVYIHEGFAYPAALHFCSYTGFWTQIKFHTCIGTVYKVRTQFAAPLPPLPFYRTLNKPTK